jgi:hypothetical protein
MAFRDTPETRAAIRSALLAHMEGPPKKGGIAITNEMQDIEGIGGPIDHETITRFAQNTHHTRRDKLEKIYRYFVYHNRIFDSDMSSLPRKEDPIGYMLQRFFGVRQDNIDLCKAFVGAYSVYFCSEDIPKAVVIGSLTFVQNRETHAFQIQEYQENKRSHGTETWEGYYFSRKNTVILMLHGQRRLDNVPKFYILHQHHFNDENGVVAETRGIMFKVSSGGSGMFHTKVLIRRTEDAVAKCDIVSVRNVEHDIMMAIR